MTPTKTRSRRDSGELGRTHPVVTAVGKAQLANLWKRSSAISVCPHLTRLQAFKLTLQIGFTLTRRDAALLNRGKCGVKLLGRELSATAHRLLDKLAELPYFKEENHHAVHDFRIFKFSQVQRSQGRLDSSQCGHIKAGGAEFELSRFSLKFLPRIDSLLHPPYVVCRGARDLVDHCDSANYPGVFSPFLPSKFESVLQPDEIGSSQYRADRSPCLHPRSALAPTEARYQHTRLPDFIRHFRLRLLVEAVSRASVAQVELHLQRPDDLRYVGAVGASVGDDANSPVRATILRGNADYAASVHVGLLSSKARQGLYAHDQHLFQLFGGAGGLRHFRQLAERLNPAPCRVEASQCTQKIDFGTQIGRFQNIRSRSSSGSLLLNKAEGESDPSNRRPPPGDVNGQFRHGPSEQQQLFLGRQCHRVENAHKKLRASKGMGMRRVVVLELHCLSGCNGHLDFGADLEANDERRSRVGPTLLRSFGVPLPCGDANSSQYGRDRANGLHPGWSICSFCPTANCRPAWIDRQRQPTEQASQHGCTDQRTGRPQFLFHLLPPEELSMQLLDTSPARERARKIQAVQMATLHHADKGGSTEKMAEVKQARDDALRELEN